jgi:PPOX class probable F420-dependent enzyme
VKTVSLPPLALDLLRGTSIGHLATLMADGSPQVTPVWVDTDGENVLINTLAGRQKHRNMERDPRVAIELMGRDPYSYVQIRGRVIEMTQQGGVEHIMGLARKYGDGDFHVRPGDVRLIVKIAPQRVHVYQD